MYYKISKEFHFSASHQLNGLAEGHPCGRVHGHNYVVVVHLKSSELDSKGFVKDYGELKPVKLFIDQNFDHQHLNNIIEANPTAENIARFLYRQFFHRFPEVYAITVKETPKTEATYYGD